MNVQSSSSPASGLPPVNQALEPAWVRNGSSATKKAYETALAFEQTLVEQLSKSMTTASGLAGESSQEGESGVEEGGSSAAGASQLSSMLPQALTSSLMEAGGLGLAAQMTQQLKDASGAVQSGSSVQSASTSSGVNETGGTGL
jgi:Rod binding domain-containing protein